MNLPQSELLYAAAYRVCFEKFDPDNCVTKMHLEAVCQTYDKIIEWANSQDQLIKDAYIRAANEVKQRAADRLENHERAMAAMAAFESIPKPEL